MAKDEKNTELETPDYEKLTTADAVDAEILKHKEILVHKDRIQAQLIQAKKDYVKATNDDLKIVAEERDHAMGVIGALEDRKKMLNKIIPLKSTGN